MDSLTLNQVKHEKVTLGYTLLNNKAALCILWQMNHREKKKKKSFKNLKDIV